MTISTACSSPSSDSSAPSAANSSIGVPLATSVTTPTGTWATFPMGHLDDPTNTFWEIFTLPAGRQQWAEHTPPDVADNGGLVIAPTSTGAVVGFRPSQLLSFSPLASTNDGGTTYTPGLLSGGLANVPNALSVSPSGRAAALTATQVLASAALVSAWQPVTTVAAIGALSAGKACGVQQLTAVMTTDTDVFLGLSCSLPGVVGLLQRAGSTFVSAGVQLPTADAKDVTEVLRIVQYTQGVAALIGVHDGSTTSYIAAWKSAPGSAAWTLSAPQPVDGGLLSTGVTSDAGFSVLTKAASGALSAAVITGPGSNWTMLASPPAGTATISVAADRSDALVVDSATFTDYRLTGPQWVKVQTVQVAIPYGSSG
ncbi:MAG TPA: hypothetical protein VIJ31_07795 [Acidothermaceae bacterium]